MSFFPIRKKRVLFLLLFLIAIAFMGVGIYRKELIPIFEKATNICFECIGIG